MAKKYNKGRKQKPNVNRKKAESPQEEISKELVVDDNLKQKSFQKKPQKAE